MRALPILVGATAMGGKFGTAGARRSIAKTALVIGKLMGEEERRADGPEWGLLSNGGMSIGLLTGGDRCRP
jgi:hypothetical protein